MNIDRFVILKRIGQGGQADVFEVYDDKLDRKVALKLIRLGPEHRKAVQNARLLREAKALAKLEHPNVVRVHDAGTFEGAAYLVMEIKAGESLRHWLREQRRRWPEIVSKFVAAGRGLHAAHRQGIVHRDFKADNVFVDEHVGAVLGDFGLAFVGDEPVSSSGDTQSESGALGGADAPLTEDGHRLGTVGYIAPECERGSRATPQSDQYSFCVSLYEALFGSLPRPGVELRPRRRGDEPPASLVRALRRGLAEEPAARFADMAALLAALSAKPGRRLAMVASVAAAAVVLGVAWRAYAASPEHCGDEGRKRFEAVWNDSRSEAVAAAIGEVPLPFARQATTELQTFAADYGDRWVAAHEAMCVALTPDKEACLDRQLARFSNVIELYSKPDRESVTRLIDVLGSLDDPAECERAGAPVQAGTPEWLRSFLDQLELQIVAGDFGRAKIGAEAAFDASYGYPAARTRALYLTGWLEASSASSRAAIDRLQEAALQAAEIRDFDTLARASSFRLKSLVNDLGEYDEAAQQAPWVEGMMRQVPAESPIRRRFITEFAEAEDYGSRHRATTKRRRCSTARRLHYAKISWVRRTPSRRSRTIASASAGRISRRS
ncbi:serine/threonine-protein kinase [Nannocystis pusilla]|uniref:serine/threonine-protein kinase n=1 Tax=Nannocystis pusilla TaxID=889268 RepID=UPI003B82BB49